MILALFSGALRDLCGDLSPGSSSSPVMAEEEEPMQTPIDYTYRLLEFIRCCYGHQLICKGQERVSSLALVPSQHLLQPIAVVTPPGPVSIQKTWGGGRLDRRVLVCCGVAFSRLLRIKLGAMRPYAAGSPSNGLEGSELEQIT